MANSNRLLVEDHDLRGVVAGLMQHHVDWGDDQHSWPAHIEVLGGKKNVLKERGIKTELKGSGVRSVGIIVDADDDFDATWAQVRSIGRSLGAAVPSTCPIEGLVAPVGDQFFGAWIMPNNQTIGAVEDFCCALVPTTSTALWTFADECKKAAKSHGADYRHSSKAHMHTWLAWRDPPGEKMGRAIHTGILECRTNPAVVFVDWFKRLFLPDPTTSDPPD